uniref:Zinc finger, HIT-type containing 3 n=1 Tax=Cyprinus carpio carpio TaxID=630221 RepID=A0A9J8CAV1_CYPCA
MTHTWGRTPRPQRSNTGSVPKRKRDKNPSCSFVEFVANMFLNTDVRPAESDNACHPVKESDSASSSSTPASSAEQPWTVEDRFDEDIQTDKVPLQKLQQLADSEALKGLLRNPHLRRLMMSVDSAEDKAKATKDAMQEPLFVEFADQCLKIIEPTEAENDDDGF